MLPPDSVEGLLCSTLRSVCDTKTHICLLELVNVRALFKAPWLSVTDLMFLRDAQFTDHTPASTLGLPPKQGKFMQSYLDFWLLRTGERAFPQTRRNVYLSYSRCTHSLLSIYFVCGTKPRLRLGTAPLSSLLGRGRRCTL